LATREKANDKREPCGALALWPAITEEEQKAALKLLGSMWSISTSNSCNSAWLQKNLFAELHIHLVLAKFLVGYDEDMLYIISNHEFQMPVKVQKAKLVLARWTWNAVRKRPAQA